jgi:putative hemolysin
MKDHMEASLAMIQLGITLFGAIAAATGGAGIAQSFSPFLQSTFGFSVVLADIIALATLIIPLSGLTIIFAELVPKMFALNHRELVCLKLSPIMKMLLFAVYPIIRILEYILKKIIRLERLKPKIVKEELQEMYELKAAASLARAARLIGAHEERIVLAAAHLSTRPIKDIMLPATDISTIPIDNSLTDALIKAHLDMHTRFPVCTKEGDPQTIEGYVNFKDIVTALKVSPANPTLRGIIRAMPRLDTTMPISEALSQLIQNKTHIALVVAKTGRIAGMITLEDIIEELIGEIEDEFDRPSIRIQSYGSGWLMGGGVSMKTVAQKLELKDFDEHSPDANLTLSEWCRKKLNQPFRGGEVIEDANICVVVRKLRRKKLSEAVVSKKPGCEK